MSLKLGGLGVAFAVSLALVAIAAPAAQAEGHYVCEVAPCIATAENVGKIKYSIGSSSSECEGVLQGTTSTEEGTGGLGTVLSSSCTKGSMTMNHCAFSPGNSTSEGLADVTLECAAENKVEVVTGMSCTLFYSPQTTKKAVHYTNVEEGVTAEGSATLTATSKSGAGCALIPNTAKVEGISLTRCYKDLGEKVEGTSATTPAVTSLGEEVECYVEE